jgi:hypothetical protein
MVARVGPRYVSGKDECGWRDDIIENGTAVTLLGLENGASNGSGHALCEFASDERRINLQLLERLERSVAVEQLELAAP